MTMQSPEDRPQQIDIDPGAMLERIDGWIDGAVRLLPNLGVAVLVFAAFWGAGALARRLIGRAAGARGRDNLGAMLGGFAKAALVVLGALLAATIVMPTLSPGDLIAGLGIGSVAIGFAFKDILQNWLAGLLLLIRQPFEVGDKIAVGGLEGTVQRIETRATIIRTFDGTKAVIPNSQIYGDSLVVKTGYEKRRSEYDVGIGYGDDIGAACEVILGVLRSVEGVEADPAPQALPWDLAASWVTIRARWWTDSRRTSIVAVRSQVLQGIKEALDEARIDMPYETRVHLLHDQTEAGDGDRSQQREGWPAPAGTEGGAGRTKPRWRAVAELRNGSE